MYDLLEFTIYSYTILLTTCLVFFAYGLFLQMNHGPILFLDLIVGIIILAIIILIYSVYARRTAKKDGVGALAVLPFKYEDLIISVSYITFPGIILPAYLAPWTLLIMSGCEFSIIAFILNHLFANNPASAIESRKSARIGRIPFSFHLTQPKYTFLYIIAGLSMIITGIVVGIARLAA